MSADTDALSAGLMVFFRKKGLHVHEVAHVEAGRFTVWVEGNERQARQVVELLPLVSQIVAYRFHPTSNAVVELYALGADVPDHRVTWINRSSPVDLAQIPR